ncbi:trimeric LpxA-like protein [Metschnikowia bicuspidata var. bicuspidata NRRL YB-4993]|uniref:Dynactin subunit 5 n=1 Tax=Metschnikowia bicuspidata var. bicuspidata NRRL YB-4993 TaxID=869754 RepID=A0A1A0HHQ4_9ASCO|nr:trimeric LpxA-like protein [Metschnikowia bicuspidata var. bicuspidata NRRL YB-4993]OBA23536.1 trimeric LpxA-like protein [Metschnikowia bicuspidata var. bicuspidata NRRL YB-4993]
MDDWIETGTGNRISRLAIIKGANRISILENCTISENCTLNGNVATLSPSLPSIVLGKYTYLGCRCLIDPPRANPSPDASVFTDVKVGNYTTLGADSVVRLIQVGNRVLIGARCVLGELSVINDCCVIEDDTVVPANSVVPPYSRVSGVPGIDYSVVPISASYRKVLEADSRVRHVLK